MFTLTSNLPKCRECPIRSSALFGSLDAGMLDQVRSLRVSQQLLKSGEHLYHQGDTPATAYTVFEGWVALYRHSPDGNRQILRFALPGEFLGFKVGVNSTYDHSAKALSETKLCAFPIQKLLGKMSETPELIFAIQAMNDAVIERCHSSITSIASKSAEAKVAFLFMTLFAREQSIRQVNSKCIPFPLTQEDIADALGLTSIHVNRVIQGLRNKGLIACKNRCLSVLDHEELIKVAQMEPYEVQRFSNIATA